MHHDYVPRTGDFVVFVVEELNLSWILKHIRIKYQNFLSQEGKKMTQHLPTIPSESPGAGLQNLGVCKHKEIVRWKKLNWSVFGFQLIKPITNWGAA